MPKEIVHIETTGELQLFGAAKYLAVLAYPDNFDKRTQFVNACRAWAIKKSKGMDGQLKRRLVYKPEILKFAETRSIKRQFDRVTEIIRLQRVPVLNIATSSVLSFVEEERLKKIGVKSDKKTIFTIKRFLNKNNTHNDYSRIWAPSKSIAHLILGFNNALLDCPKKHSSVETLLLNPAWINTAVVEAEKARINFCLKGIMKIRDEDTIQLLPAAI